MSATSYGWALRTSDTCGDSEAYCGETVFPYSVCCPGGSFCPSQYNAACCPTLSNCTNSLVAEPKCADETWDLYDNRGYFCCLQGRKGFSTSYNSDGCASPGYELDIGEEYLPIIKRGQGSPFTDLPTNTDFDPFPSETDFNTFPSATTFNPFPSTTDFNQYPSPTFDSPHERPGYRTNVGSARTVGAVVGGVTAGVVVLAIIGATIFVLVKRKSKSNAPASQVPGTDGGEKPVFR